ncbi:MAG TPA: polysaccharide deacetylase family protein [Polyangiaceae bacterium]|nr:polysaccharide deacetylase family protein [Polyangiaceae bacterium]
MTNPETRAAASSDERDELGPTYLFSVDLEDVRSLFPGGQRLAERVPENTERFLGFLDRHRIRCTFFTTGDVARRYPSLVRTVAAAGHEIGCHTSDHTALDRHDADSFRSDIQRCQEVFERAGVTRSIGFRAPYGSMTARTAWAYRVLGKLGFEYSASVLPARNPLYGWPEFGPDRPRMLDGLLEVPVTLTHLPGLNVPLVGGIYFRLLPFPLIRRIFRRRLANGEPVAGYLHPFDIDSREPRFPFPDMNPLFSWLMFQNRDAVFPRLERLLELGVRVMPYAEYAAHQKRRLGARPDRPEASVA